MSDSAEGSPVIQIALEDTFQQRPVNTKVYEPFLIARLMEHPAVVNNSLEYQVIMQNVGSPGIRSETVRWTWTQAMIPPTPLAVQAENMTEVAAYALAFAVISTFTEASLVTVARRGERFDYVLSENGARCGVEISGTQTEGRQMMRDRQAQKIRQLLDNPNQWGGYVVIVGFARREVLLSRHAPGE